MPRQRLPPQRKQRQLREERPMKLEPLKRLLRMRERLRGDDW
jgi:hypothetical protein